jgi:hypothetical protein
MFTHRFLVLLYSKFRNITIETTEDNMHMPLCEYNRHESESHVGSILCRRYGRLVNVRNIGMLYLLTERREEC